MRRFLLVAKSIRGGCKWNELSILTMRPLICNCLVWNVKLHINFRYRGQCRLPDELWKHSKFDGEKSQQKFKEISSKFDEWKKRPQLDEISAFLCVMSKNSEGVPESGVYQKLCLTVIFWIIFETTKRSPLLFDIIGLFGYRRNIFGDDPGSNS